MKFAVELMRYLLIGVANIIPRFHTLDYIRTSLLRIAGLKIGPDTRISGNLVLEFSFRKPSVKNVIVGSDSFIGNYCRISALKSRVSIGDRCNIGPGVSIDTAGHWFNREANKRNSYHKPVVIHDNVWVGAGCIILPGVTIGQNSIVAAGAVVAKDVPEGVLVGGVPARVIKALPEFGSDPSLAPADDGQAGLLVKGAG
ncbi:acyltransferase [Methylorubrum thiocyanatum]|uniref:acyltransferase n=1 Tax=Methylorubrum thiocyanatum TaxID=47958 RepID=UPI003655EF5D